jgi:hypothetical protein
MNNEYHIFQNIYFITVAIEGTNKPKILIVKYRIREQNSESCQSVSKPDVICHPCRDRWHILWGTCINDPMRRKNLPLCWYHRYPVKFGTYRNVNGQQKFTSSVKIVLKNLHLMNFQSVPRCHRHSVKFGTYREKWTW